MVTNPAATGAPASVAPAPTPTKSLVTTSAGTAGGTRPAPSRMSIANLRRGKVAAAWRVLLYGLEGVGKTMWPMGADAPAYLCAESGTEQYDIPRLPEPQTWDDVFEAIRSLREDAHDRKTLVIDTVDWLEPLCWKHVCAKGGNKDSIEDFGYGKGYVAALDEWRRFLAALEQLRRTRGMWIVLLAHAQIKAYKNPEGPDYDRFQLKLHDKAGGLIKEWCDAVLFANFDHAGYQKTEKDKAKGVGIVGARIVHTQRSPAFDAKNRFNLPLTMPLSWADFVGHVEAGSVEVDPTKLLAEIDALAAQLAGKPKEVFDPVGFAKARADSGQDPAALARLLDRMRAKVAIATPETQATPAAAAAAGAPPAPAA